MLANNVFAAGWGNNGYTYGYVSGGQARCFTCCYPPAETNFPTLLNARA